MSLSMRKKRSFKELLVYFLVIIGAIALAVGIAAILPFAYEVKKLIFFILIIVFAIVAVFLFNKLRK